MQQGGNCHKCEKNVTQDELVMAVRKLDEATEFMAARCYPSSSPPMDWGMKQGPIMNKGGKKP
jgi:hypothetical protein